MIQGKSYKSAFIGALIIHFLLAILLFTEFHSSRPVLKKENENQLGDLSAEKNLSKPQEIVKAVSVDNQELMKTVQHLKDERRKKMQAEQAKQTELLRQAETLKKERLQEQERINKLKQEAEKLAVERKKQLVEEQNRLKILAQEKAKEAKKLEDLKKQQEILEKKQEKERVEAENRKIQAEKLAALKAEEEQQQQALQRKAELEKAEAAENSARQAKLAGEVNKYKALIINAISRRWILPENVDNRLSSQFKIRLAPDGVVLDVTLLRSSGDPILDRSAQNAIYKASPLPVPSDPATFNLFREISLTVRPENIRG